MQGFYSLKKYRIKNMQLLKQRHLSIRDQKYLTTNIIYIQICKAKVISRKRSYQEKVYFGLCKTTFKKWLSITKNRNKYKNETELPNVVWPSDSSHHPPKR